MIFRKNIRIDLILIKFSNKLLPDFIIIGTQRAGTTSLYRYLCNHPQIKPAKRKEVHFFDLKYKKGIEWYQSQFKKSGIFSRLSQKKKLDENYVTGEASPYYIFHPLVPKRVLKHLPHVKIIILLRNPIERAFSHYHHEIRLGAEKLSFEEAIKNEPSRLQGEVEKMVDDPYYYSFNHQHFSYLARGEYVKQLKIWKDLFPENQLKIISSEELFENPSKILNEVLSFLELPTYVLLNKKPHNEGVYSPMKEDTRIKLKNFFIPYNQQLYDFLRKDYGWS